MNILDSFYFFYYIVDINLKMLWPILPKTYLIEKCKPRHKIIAILSQHSSRTYSLSPN